MVLTLLNSSNMQRRLKVERLEWVDKSHFLYSSVPTAVVFKVESFLSQSIDLPVVDDETKSRWDDSFNCADDLMFPEKQTHQHVLNLFNDLCDCIAFLSFVEGGVEIFGHQYEVLDGSSKT